LLAQIPAEGIAAVAGKAQLAVGVILDEQQIGGFDDLRSFFAYLGAVGEACGILEAWDD
jgi:hypothetical protein